MPHGQRDSPTFTDQPGRLPTAHGPSQHATSRLNSPLRNAALLVLLTAVTIPMVLALVASGTFAAMTLILGG